MPKADKILGMFPAVYRATEAQSLLGAVVRAGVQPLEEADTHLFRVQRAHRLNVAEHPLDIVRLAAALNLGAFHFEDLLALPYAEIERMLTLMRRRTQRIARIHLAGTGTPWAIMEGAATFLNAMIEPRETGGPLLRRQDAEGYSHEAAIRFDQTEGTPADRLVLHENPFRRKRVEAIERYTGDVWPTVNKMPDPAPLAIAVKGIGDRTVRPSLYCPANRQGVMFDGIVPDGATLILDETGEARLDGEVVNQWIVTWRGGVFDEAVFDRDTVVAEESTGVPPFAGDENPPLYQPRVTLPEAPIGRGEWRFTVAEGRWDKSQWDFAVFPMPDLPSGVYDGDFNFDGSVFSVAPNAVVGMGWNERIACAFKLLLPQEPPAVGAGTKVPVNYGGRVAAVMPRLRAAGVRAYVEAMPDSWRIGESAIRNGEATKGEGVERRSTIVRGRYAEMFAPIENDAASRSGSGGMETAHG
jgi:hypothetical protein